MGGSASKSSVKLENNTYVTNQSTINQLNETIISTIVNLTVQNVKSSSAALLASNKIVITGIKAGQDITITTEQTQSGMLDFSSIQLDSVTTAITDNLTKNILNEITSKASSDVVQKMNADANSKTEQEWGAIGWAQSSATAKEKVLNDIKNITTKNFSTVINQSVTTNFTQKNLSTCVATATAIQELQTSNFVAGRNVTLTANQTQAIQLFAKCVQDSNVAQNITKNITDFYKMKVVDDQASSTTTTQTGQTSAETKMGGFFSINSLLSFGGVIVFIIILLAGIAVYKHMNKDDGEENIPQSNEKPDNDGNDNGNGTQKGSGYSFYKAPTKNPLELFFNRHFLKTFFKPIN